MPVQHPSDLKVLSAKRETTLHLLSTHRVRLAAIDISDAPDYGKEATRIALGYYKGAPKSITAGFMVTRRTVVEVDGEVLKGETCTLIHPSYFGTLSERSREERDREGFKLMKHCAATVFGRSVLEPGHRVLDPETGLQTFEEPRLG